MKCRIKQLWKVPVFCLISSIISFLVTVYWGGRFFTAETIGPDGIPIVSIDPIRSAVFNGALFVIVLLLGGFWAFRGMTKSEIALSAAIISGIYFTIALTQLYLPNFPVSISLMLAYIQNWTGTIASALHKITDNFQLAVLLANFAPFLFVPFGCKLDK